MPFKILLLEKDQDTRLNWGELLQLSGFNVVAQNYLTQFAIDYDAIIADTDIVGIAGGELKSLLKAEQHVPIVFTSADCRVPPVLLDEEELAEVTYLQKPFDNPLLLEHLYKAKRYKHLIESRSDATQAIARLQVRQPGRTPVEWVLSRCYTFGRCRESDTNRPDIQLHSSSASRKHAYLIRVYRDKESYYKLVDLSSNGISINGNRMGRSRVLQHGDAIEFYSGCTARYELIDRKAIDLDQTLSSDEG